jgi:hypothetical protein
MLSNERLGRFTASGIHNLFVGGKGVTKDNYIFKKAEERVKGYSKSFSSRHTDHGIVNESEALENFVKVTGINALYLDETYYPINEDSGATPDFAIIKDGIMVASGDMKCPTEKFFEQKLMLFNEKNAAYQDVPKEYFYQGQMQMLALSKYNEILGHPPVKEHYLVRYLTSTQYDDDGNKIEIDLPLEARIFYKLIKADEAVQNQMLKEIEKAVEQRDLLISIFIRPII